MVAFSVRGTKSRCTGGVTGADAARQGQPSASWAGDSFTTSAAAVGSSPTGRAVAGFFSGRSVGLSSPPPASGRRGERSSTESTSGTGLLALALCPVAAGPQRADLRPRDAPQVRTTAAVPPGGGGEVHSAALVSSGRTGVWRPLTLDLPDRAGSCSQLS